MIDGLLCSDRSCVANTLGYYGAMAIFKELPSSSVHTIDLSGMFVDG